MNINVEMFVSSIHLQYTVIREEPEQIMGQLIVHQHYSWLHRGVIHNYLQ